MTKAFGTYIFIICMMIGGATHAQKNEFGVGLGAFNYAGDMMRGYPISNVKPGLVAYYKRNLDNIFSFRFSATTGIVSGSDNNPIDAFAAQRMGSFQSTVLELGAILEYNFLDFRTDPHRIRYSPYLLLGFGGAAFLGGNEQLQGSSPVQPTLIFGGGFKYLVNENLTLNLEVGLRSMFFDYLDGYSDADITNKNYQNGNKYDNDWYNFIGISISYLIWDVPCPYDFY